MSKNILLTVDLNDESSSKKSLPVAVACCGAFGAREGACGLAAALGGHVRVGFENNTRLSDGSIAPDNAALVAQARAGAALLGREIADAQTARDMLWGLFD